jgi:hypothetical protein
MDGRACLGLFTFRRAYVVYFILLCLILIFEQFISSFLQIENAWTQFSIYRSHKSAEEEDHVPRVMTEHPITKLMEEAEQAFNQKLARQSRELKDAVAEYKRRYKRDPPKGFDQWWDFARNNSVLLVDEYDGLVEDLAPFWDISGAELRKRVHQVLSSTTLPSFR